MAASTIPTVNPAFEEFIKQMAAAKSAADAGVATSQSAFQGALAQPMPEAPAPDFGNPMAAFLSSFAGNLATGISGNPNYQQNANNMIGQQRQEAKQTAREKLSMLMQQRSEFLAEKMEDLRTQRAAAAEAGDGVLKATLAKETDKVQREQIAAAERQHKEDLAQRVTEGAKDRGVQQQRNAIDAQQLKIQQFMADLDAAKAGYTNDPKTNSIINHRIRYNNVNENIKNIINASKGKIKDEKTVFKRFPGLKSEYEAALGAGLAPLKEEQAQEYVDRRVAAGLPVDKVVEAAKKQWPKEDWSAADEVVGAGSAPDQSMTRLNALIGSLSGMPFPATFNPVLSGVAGAIGGAGQALSLPLNAAKYFNEPLVPDSSKVSK